MQDLRRANRSFEALATYHYDLINLTGEANHAPEGIVRFVRFGQPVSDVGSEAHARPEHFAEEDQIGRDQELILSYGLWTRRFASESGVIGRSVEVNGRQRTIISLMPAGFDFPFHLSDITRTSSQHMDF